MKSRHYFAYAALLLVLAISLTYRVRQIIDRSDRLLHGTERVQPPFSLDSSGLSIVSVRPEADAAGVRTGNTLVAIGGRPYRGVIDLYVPLREAQPGDRLNVEVRASDGADGSAMPASIELQSLRTGTPLTFSEALQEVLAAVMPLFCVLLGFWVAAVRIRDPMAWVFLAMMISFGETLAGGYTISRFGHDDFFQPIGAAYEQFASSVWSLSMMLFGIYFPERVEFDRRRPWVKWLLTLAILFRAFQNALSGMLAGRDVVAGLRVGAFLRFEAATTLIHMAAISYFFIAIGHKSFHATNADSRRRLRLLYTGAMISLTPAFLLFLARTLLGLTQLENSAIDAFTIYLLLLGFPLTMAYVIVVQRAMDVRVVIRQGVQYVLASKGVTILQFILSIAVVLTASIGVEGLKRYQRIEVVAAGIFAMMVIRQFAIQLRSWVDQRFFREAYDAEQILIELAEKVRSIVETRPLLQLIAHRISESLHVARVAILLNGPDGFRLAYAVGYPTPPEINIPGGVNFESTVRESLQSELVLPLSLNEKVLGLLSLGPKRSEEPYSKGDIRLLGSVATQAGLALENSRLAAAVAAEVAQRERMNRELEIAREVQERLFPQDLPQYPGIDYAGMCRPALGVGGDYYDFIQLSETEIGIAIGDVSGKGIPAALLMASLRASLRGQTIRREGDLALLMANVNKLLYEGSTSNRYATFFYAEYNAISRSLTYVNAGHNPPLIFRKDHPLMRLETGGPVVGLLPSFPYTQATVELQPRDVLIAFTDGISEAMNVSDQEWGEDQLIECVRRAAGCDARQTIAQILAGADDFAAGAKQHDDMTLIVLKVGNSGTDV